VRARAPLVQRLVVRALRHLRALKVRLRRWLASPDEPDLERLISVIGCLLEHIEGDGHTRALVHPDCQACLDVRSANELLDELTAHPH
jgi:hypothetical protein